MRFFSLLLIIIFLLVGANAFATDGDLIVNGNIGVGTTTPGTNLEVNGGIRAGNVTAACTSAVAGIMRWNSTSAIYEYCNGTAWMPMAGTTNKTWQMIWSTDVTAATASVTATGLNGDLDQEYIINIRGVNGGSDSANFYAQPNGDSNPANYYFTYHFENNSAGGGDRSQPIAGLFIGQGNAGNDFFGTTFLHAQSGRIRMANTKVSAYGAPGVAPWDYNGATNWQNTSSNITSITFTGNSASSLGIGTHIEIWTKR